MLTLIDYASDFGSAFLNVAADCETLLFFRYQLGPISFCLIEEVYSKLKPGFE